MINEIRKKQKKITWQYKASKAGRQADRQSVSKMKKYAIE